jgi:hypothetical protein
LRDGWGLIVGWFYCRIVGWFYGWIALPGARLLTETVTWFGCWMVLLLDCWMVYDWIALSGARLLTETVTWFGCRMVLLPDCWMVLWLDCFAWCTAVD